MSWNKTDVTFLCPFKHVLLHWGQKVASIERCVLLGPRVLIYDLLLYIEDIVDIAKNVMIFLNVHFPALSTSLPFEDLVFGLPADKTSMFFVLLPSFGLFLELKNQVDRDRNHEVPEKANSHDYKCKVYHRVIPIVCQSLCLADLVTWCWQQFL